jgi:hypothetical protein
MHKKLYMMTSFYIVTCHNVFYVKIYIFSRTITYKMFQMQSAAAVYVIIVTTEMTLIVFSPKFFQAIFDKNDILCF